MLENLHDDSPGRLLIDDDALFPVCAPLIRPLLAPVNSWGAVDNVLSNKLTVLFVDDEEDIIETLRLQFTKTFSVYTASSAAMAKDRMREIEWVDVVVADLCMPHESGLDLLGWIKDNYTDVGRILLSGKADMDDAVEAVNEINVSRLLTKPCPAQKLTNAILQAGLDNRLRQVRQSLNEPRYCKEIKQAVSRSLLHVVRQRDPNMVAHQIRVAKLSHRIGRELNLAESRRDDLEIAARLHDIGKIFAPLDYLEATSDLGDEEFSIISRQLESGFDILSGIEEMTNVAKIIYQHHERIDGSGYPLGLSRTQILLEARILAVADAIDAMLSHKSYRSWHDVERAKRELRQQKGILFDSVVVDAALNVLNDGMDEEAWS